MRVGRATRSLAKGWYFGRWNSSIPVAVGYANAGIDEPHLHRTVTEIYLIARGSATVRAGDQTVRVEMGDVLAIEPGEAHTFLDSSDDYLHFVVQTPSLEGEEAAADKEIVERARLGL